ncbi:MAG TPA: hypothetical protein PK781_09400 [Terrimesophilobacter sp.]|nr:hypothetical protein [Terrimesophilobacter sp.]
MKNTERAVESHGSDALLERLAVIEEQPLESRAEAFGQLHEELQRELDGGHAD